MNTRLPVILGFLLIIFIIGSYTGYLILEEPVKYECIDCNVVIFTIDTLRADHVSSYGYFEETTPFLDEVAEKGISFENAFSQIPHTPPSHWSIFTGLYPYRHGKFIPPANGSDLVSLPEILRDNGYTTSAFIGSYMVKGFADEFEYFNSYTGKEKYKQLTFRPALKTTTEALSWLDNHSRERFFLWVHYFDPHSPYEPPEGYDIYNYTSHTYYHDEKYSELGLRNANTIRHDIAKYDGEIRYTDDSMGLILEKIRELGIENNTLILIVSDHGECFGEHNFTDFGYEENRPCLFHGKTLYEEEIHVPLVIMNPNSSLQGARVNDLVETVDIVPTILDILNISFKLDIDGASLVPLITGRGSSKGYAISQTRPKKSGSFSIGIRNAGWKFVRMCSSGLNLEEDIAEQEGSETISEESEGDSCLVKKMLFSMGEGEHTNYFNLNRFVADRMEGMIRIMIEKPVHRYEIDKETEEMLKSLGYLQ